MDNLQVSRNISYKNYLPQIFTCIVGMLCAVALTWTFSDLPLVIFAIVCIGIILSYGIYIASKKSNERNPSQGEVIKILFLHKTYNNKFYITYEYNDLKTYKYSIAYCLLPYDLGKKIAVGETVSLVRESKKTKIFFQKI